MNIKNQIEMKLREHSRYSPSALGKLMQCPEYVSGPSTADSMRGTKLHKIMETGEGYDELSPEDRSAIDRAKALVNEVIKITFPQGIGSSFTDLRETKLDTRIDEVWGTLDRCIIDVESKKILAIDFKFGVQPVQPAASNFQAIAYTLALLHEYPLVEEVYFAFIMPAIPGVNGVNAHLFSAGEREMLTQMIKDEVERIKNNKRLKPHHLLCSTCAKYLECRAVKAKVNRVLKELLASEGKMNVTSARIRDVRLAEKWIALYLKEVKSQMEKGLQVEGWQLSRYLSTNQNTDVTLKDVYESPLNYEDEALEQIKLKTSQCRKLGGDAMIEFFKNNGKIKTSEQIKLLPTKKI